MAGVKLPKFHRGNALNFAGSSCRYKQPVLAINWAAIAGSSPAGKSASLLHGMGDLGGQSAPPVASVKSLKKGAVYHYRGE